MKDKKSFDRAFEILQKRHNFLQAVSSETALNPEQKTEMDFCNGILLIHETGYPVSESIEKAVQKYETAIVLWGLGCSLSGNAPFLIEEALNEIKDDILSAKQLLIE